MDIRQKFLCYAEKIETVYCLWIRRYKVIFHFVVTLITLEQPLEVEKTLPCSVRKVLGWVGDCTDKGPC